MNMPTPINHKNKDQARKVKKTGRSHTNISPITLNTDSQNDSFEFPFLHRYTPNRINKIATASGIISFTLNDTSPLFYVTFLG